MTLPTVRTRDVYKWGPCWDKEKLDAFVDKLGDRKWTALDVLDPEQLPGVRDADRLWLVLRPEMVPHTIRQRFARECADREVPAAFRRAAEAARAASEAATRAAGAASEAASEAARDARAASQAAERRWQVARLREMLAE